MVDVVKQLSAKVDRDRRVERLPRTRTLQIATLFLCIISAIVYVLYVKKWAFMHKTEDNYQQRKSKFRQPETKAEHRGVIEFTPVGQKQLRRHKDRQASRARPNKGLQRTFGIANAFTTEDLNKHAKFLKEAIQKMQSAIQIDGMTCHTKEGDWSMLKEVAQSSADLILSQKEDKLRIVDVVRFVTFKVSLKYLFNTSDTSISSNDPTIPISRIGQSINDLWTASKDNENPPPEWSSKANSHLHEDLSAVCQLECASSADEINPLDPDRNPLNWLLPAYETMWRAVLACVIETCFRNAENAHVWRKALQDYVSDMTQEIFKGTHTPLGVRSFCANDVVKETLRLYPPTRHVKRRFTDDGEDVKADIEFCHRDNAHDAFGPDSLCFRPERWLEIRAHLGPEKKDKDVKILEEECGFIPFAIHCPAGQSSTQGFGFKMIAILAGVLCERLGTFTEWELESKEIFQDLGIPLPTNRAAFDNLYLIKGVKKE